MRTFLPLGLEGRDLSAVMYEFVGEDNAESTSEGAIPLAVLCMLRAEDLCFRPKRPPRRGMGGEIKEGGERGTTVGDGQ